MYKTLMEGEKILLSINDVEIVLTRKKLISLLEQHFDFTSELQDKISWNYIVVPNSINQEVFRKQRKDERQERTRQIILSAFMAMQKNPDKYTKSFEILIPKKEKSSQTVKKMIEMSGKIGDHIADWVEQALEWAQRISNGEAWEDICNNPDKQDWFRLIIWKNGKARIVGNSNRSNVNLYIPYSSVSNLDCLPDEIY